MSHLLFLCLFFILLPACVDKDQEVKKDDQSSIRIIPAPKYLEQSEENSDVDAKTSQAEKLQIVLVGDSKNFSDEEMQAVAHYVSLDSSSESLNLIPSLGGLETEAANAANAAKAEAANAAKTAKAAKAAQKTHLPKTQPRPAANKPTSAASNPTSAATKSTTEIQTKSFDALKTNTFNKALSALHVESLKGMSLQFKNDIQKLEQLSKKEGKNVNYIMHTETYMKLSAPYGPQTLESLYVIERIPVGEEVIIAIKLK